MPTRSPARWKPSTCCTCTGRNGRPASMSMPRERSSTCCELRGADRVDDAQPGAPRRDDWRRRGRDVPAVGGRGRRRVAPQRVGPERVGRALPLPARRGAPGGAAPALGRAHARHRHPRPFGHRAGAGARAVRVAARLGRRASPGEGRTAGARRVRRTQARRRAVARVLTQRRARARRRAHHGGALRAGAA